MEIIKFFDKTSPYFEFSNYYSCIFILEDKVWYSVESYYQSQKFNTPETNLYYRMVSRADSSQKAKDMANLRPNLRGKHWLINKNYPALGKMNDCIEEFKRDTSIRPDWEEVKMNVMKKGLYAKFTQNPALLESLLSTGEREIIENSPYDSFWGCGSKGDGQNHLGKLLMRLRSHLRK
jgi:predicted NAD-dependent protein-ADP-ribosyltransferase YbiA (DUF1768 family)